jgi:serine/threonine protein kinase
MKFKFLGYGYDGVILYPAFSNHVTEVNKYVTKIGMKEQIENEKYIYDNLPNEYNNIIYNNECYISTFNNNNKLLNNNCLTGVKSRLIYYDRQITIRLFNGKNLAKILHDDSKITKPQIYNLFKKMIFLYKCMKKLNSKYNIFHRDITQNNILYNPEKDEIRIIDFVQSQKYPTGQFPDFLPNKDLSDTINVINAIIEFITKTKNYMIMSPIKNLNELIINMKYIKTELLN